MDPIHPILPQPINIPPVVEAPSVGRINRDDQRRESDRRKSRRAKDRPSLTGTTAHDNGDGLDDNDPDDGRPRIDIVA